MRRSTALLAVLLAASLSAGASAMHNVHFRASHQPGMHYRASHSSSSSVVVHRSACRGPIVVTTWQPSHRLYRSGFGHFSRPTIVAQPGFIHSSRGPRGLCGGFVTGHRTLIHRGNSYGYNGSVGSNNADRRKVDWEKRARVHSPRVVTDND
jgi:hypothetical protein